MISFVAEGYSRPAEIAAVACASIPETAAEKLVALTRRAGAELAGLREKRDTTLVRHVYDLHAIRSHYAAADVASLAHEIMAADAEMRGDSFFAYKANPLVETLKAIEGIAASAEYAADYATFSRDMVYGEAADFQTAAGTLKALAERVAEVPGLTAASWAACPRKRIQFGFERAPGAAESRGIPFRSCSGNCASRRSG